MKKILAILMAAVMVAVLMPVHALAADLETDALIKGITLDAPGVECYGGYKMKSSTDPTGVYAATYGYLDNDDSVYYYFIRHYLYLSRYHAYVADESFGELNIKEAELATSGYSRVGVTTSEKAVIKYDYNAEESSYYSCQKLNRASDPDGVYGCSPFTTGDNRKGYRVYKFKAVTDGRLFIVDESFAYVDIYEEDFDASEYSFAYEDVFTPEELTWTGNVALGDFGNFIDENGVHYAVDDAHDVFEIDGDTVTLGGTEYFYVTRTNAVTYSELTPANEQQQEAGCVHSYVGKYAPQPTCTAAGKIVYTCSKCGDVAADRTTYVKALGHKTVIDKAVPATFKACGWTQGKHCSRCGKVITARKKIAQLGTAKISKLTAGKKLFKVTWAPVKSIDGYQIQYALKSNFSGAKTVKIKGATVKAKTIKNLKSKKYYYVRMRGYKTINGKVQYSAWSKSKIKVK